MRAQVDSALPALRLVSSLLRCVDADGFGAEIARLLRGLMPLNRVLVYAVSRDRPPLFLHAEPPTNGAAQRAEAAYFAGGYRYDPYYRAFLEGAAGGFHTDANASHPARNRWGRVQHVAYLSPVSSEAALVALLVRMPGSRSFSREELAQLRSLDAALVNALRLHWTTWAEARHAAPATGDGTLHLHVEHAIDTFGMELLTPREAQVVRLLLRGSSTRAAAERLGIAVATTALHRKRAYAKLGVCSQAELFYLFLTELAGDWPVPVVSLPHSATRAAPPRARPAQAGWSRSAAALP